MCLNCNSEKEDTTRHAILECEKIRTLREKYQIHSEEDIVTLNTKFLGRKLTFLDVIMRYKGI